MIVARTARRNIAIVIILATVIGLIYWPSLRWMVISWIGSDYYSHGFLVPFVSAFFIWTKRSQLEHRNPSWIGLIWLLLGIAMLVAGLLLQVRFLGIISLLFVIVGLVFSIFGTHTVKTLLFPLAFLIFMVPFWFVQDLAYQLQYLSVHWSAWISASLGLPIQTESTQIFLGNDITFTVGLVCSGIDTLVALLALTAVFAYIQKGSPYRRHGLFALAVPIAVAANVLRIVSIIVIAYFFNVETATGWYHDISSPLFFFLAFGSLILVARALKLKINYDVFKDTGADRAK